MTNNSTKQLRRHDGVVAVTGSGLAAIFGDSEPSATDDNRRLFKKAATRSAWDGK